MQHQRDDEETGSASCIIHIRRVSIYGGWARVINHNPLLRVLHHAISNSFVILILNFYTTYKIIP